MVYCVVQAKSEILMPYFRNKRKKHCNQNMIVLLDLVGVKYCRSNKQQLTFLLLPQQNNNSKIAVFQKIMAGLNNPGELALACGAKDWD